MNSTIIETNPIPAPTIILHYEYMVFNITHMNNNSANVSFYGKFIMENIGYKDLVLYFPVPNETIRNGHITVITNGEERNYSLTWEFVVWGKKYNYTTLLGRLPLVKWIVKDAYRLKKIIVEVLYDYKINIVNDTKTIYALGTGRYYYTYSKQVIADIFFNINGFTNTLFKLSYADPLKKEETLIHANIINKTYTKHIRLFSPMFTSFKKDLVIELKHFNKKHYLFSQYFESIINVYINNKQDTLCISGKTNLSNWGTTIATLDSHIINNDTILFNITVLQTKSPSIQVLKITTFENYVYLGNKMTHSYTILFMINGKIIDKVTLNPSIEFILLRDYLIKYHASSTTTTPIAITNITTTTPQITITTTTQAQTTTPTNTTTSTTTIPLTTTTTTQHQTTTTINSTITTRREFPINNVIVLGILVIIIILVGLVLAKRK